ncbi:MAG: hypothetical protein PHY12_14175 [Eubacteriales bacterium]|nr:hypothetical protein [Eubacteriales bacterium]
MSDSSVICYAGLRNLLSEALDAFADASVPERFRDFPPVFPLELIVDMDRPAHPHGPRVARSGFSVDPAEYFEKLLTRLPALAAGDNYARAFDYEGRFKGRSDFTVDAAWADAFPQYRSFLGDKLTLHLIGGGPQAVAVPESVYPRGGGVLSRVEQRLGIARQAQAYLAYVRDRLTSGEAYDAEDFAEVYLATAGLAPVGFTQAEISERLQRRDMVRSVTGGNRPPRLYSKTAASALRVHQYVPFLYACDRFAAEKTDRRTARLCQLCWEDADFVSDFWFSYDDLAPFVHQDQMTLDARRLCEAFQIAPGYDPRTGGGRYPDRLRVAVVRDRDLLCRVGDALNNPAYGAGGGRQVYLENSRELLRRRQLLLEDAPLELAHLSVSPADYRAALGRAMRQEQKGRLIDAMYRRSVALYELGSSATEALRQSLDARVDALQKRVDDGEGVRLPRSGYDEDLAGLRLVGVQPVASIEAGFAMRGDIVRVRAGAPHPDAE